MPDPAPVDPAIGVQGNPAVGVPENPVVGAPVNPVIQPSGQGGFAATDPIMMPEKPAAPDPVEKPAQEIFPAEQRSQ